MFDTIDILSAWLSEVLRRNILRLWRSPISLGPLIRLIWKWWVERLVCLHFCKFKAAGSTLAYTHVHILDGNPAKASGLGHDDETNTDNKGHTTVSGPDG